MNDLTSYLNGAVERLVKRALKSSFNNPRESAFITKFMLQQKSAAKKRKNSEEKGRHIPPFLIASIASQCNLFCKGCYARANESCGGDKKHNELDAENWGRIFEEASQLGISFILLAGGEPLLRRDVIEAASRVPNIVFPVFTNGTMIDENYLKFFDAHRNFVPILSVEGDTAQTDGRRGDGVSAILDRVETQMQKAGIYYGVSITVTSENLDVVTDKEFISRLSSNGCSLAFFVEYVPVQASTENLALTDEGRDQLAERQSALRDQFEMVFLSFPGDEKEMGGCLAAGRGFFHINPSGEAEPCPFSPCSDRNLKNGTLIDALNSPLFQKLSDFGFLQGEHKGGCALFDKQEEIAHLR
jgi:MoaA/NifB/PqqE/SkfB family radical SAM enzyme